MGTKYQRQILSAAATIKKKGVRVTWYKDSNANPANDTSPEFPKADKRLTFLPWLVFYPQPRQNLATILGIPVTAEASNQLFAVLAGNCGFKPEIDDELVLPDGTVTHVATINTTQPDLTPIIHEVSFK